MTRLRWTGAYGVAAILLTLPFWIYDIDLAISARFYDAHTGTWPALESTFFRFVYAYGTWPGWMLVWASLPVLIGAIWLPRLREHRRLAAFSLLLFLIGPGLIVNVVFKPESGRPRPRNVVEFGGDHTYLRPGVPGDHHDKSFPSGHAATGFVWLGFAVYFQATRPRRAAALAIIGLAHGSLLGLTRIAQGGHFLSDVLWSALFVVGSALILCFSFGLAPPAPPRNVVPARPTDSYLGPHVEYPFETS